MLTILMRSLYLSRKKFGPDSLLNLQALLVPNLISASLSERDLFLPLQDTHKLQSLTLYGHLRELPNYSLLPALTHLKWDDLYGPRTQTIEGIEPLAAASRLKSLELECYTPSEYGKISEFHRFCPRYSIVSWTPLLSAPVPSLDIFAQIDMYCCCERSSTDPAHR